MIVFAGSEHTIASFYRDKEKRRRWRETVRRLKLEDSNAPVKFDRAGRFLRGTSYSCFQIQISIGGFREAFSKMICTFFGCLDFWWCQFPLSASQKPPNIRKR